MQEKDYSLSHTMNSPFLVISSALMCRFFVYELL